MSEALLLEHAWPVSRAGDALGALLSAAPAGDLGNPAGEALRLTDVARFLEVSGASAGAEIEHVTSPFDRRAEVVVRAGPALFWIDAGGAEARLVAVLGRAPRRRRRVVVASPDGTRRTLPAATLADAWAGAARATVAAPVEAVLERAKVPEARRARAREALVAQRLGSQQVEGCFLLRIPPGGPAQEQLAAARAGRRIARALAGSVTLYAVSVSAWGMLGAAALQGRSDAGMLWAWALLLVSSLLLTAATGAVVGRLTVHLAAMLKRRLMQGALRLRPEETRHEGVGHQLGRVAEAEALEALAFRGSVLALFALLELGLAAGVLAAGATGAWHAGILVAWTSVALLLCRAFHRRREAWSDARLRITHDLVERLVGHRTRLVQEAPERWHEEEDLMLARYHELSRAMDDAGARFTAMAPRGFVLLALLGLLPLFLSGGASPGALAITLGGILLAYQTLGRAAAGWSDLSETAIAWARVRRLHDAAARTGEGAPPAFVAALDAAAARSRAEGDRHPVLDVQDASFRYPDRPEPVLRDLSLRIRRDEQLLLEGASGSGKSTLLGLLGGLRDPSSGIVLLLGLDRRTVGSSAWRRRVATAPQFHENHVLSASFGFNLLMGRGWPPSARDYADAQQLCEELGLGAVLARMPSGFEQMVGETGWQLSHGEKSRLFIARALLQDADLVVLDESFAALDPATLRTTLACVRRRARTLLVIAHP